MAHHGRLLAKRPQTPKLQEAFPVRLRTLPAGSHLGSEAPAPSPQSSPSASARNFSCISDTEVQSPPEPQGIHLIPRWPVSISVALFIRKLFLILSEAAVGQLVNPESMFRSAWQPLGWFLGHLTLVLYLNIKSDYYWLLPAKVQSV